MALTESERPLFIGFLGPLTDMASAILLEPSIVDKDIVVIWVGGPSHDPGIVSVGSWPEFNLKNDIAAANVVFESGVTLWQIPSSVPDGQCRIRRTRGKGRTSRSLGLLPRKANARVQCAVSQSTH
ncbi:nucleoside hydrolase [Paenarthrobacter ureafaciens]|uniref:nucleoside hydrolase n=1 Tax=Paenarthrobacter ureafaciens TaxID=37931 RepID=UPI001A97E88C